MRVLGSVPVSELFEISKDLLRKAGRRKTELNMTAITDSEHKRDRTGQSDSSVQITKEFTYLMPVSSPTSEGKLPVSSALVTTKPRRAVMAVKSVGNVPENATLSTFKYLSDPTAFNSQPSHPFGNLKY